MASVNRLNGFKLVRVLGAVSDFSAQFELVYVPASDSSVIMVGDAVKQLTGAARQLNGAMGVTRVSAATDVPYGIVVGIAFEGVGDAINMPPVNDLNTPVYRRASTDRYLYVVTDPNAVFEVQGSQTALTAATVAALVGKNASFSISAGNTASGSSGFALDTTSGATTATLPLKVMGYPNRPDNVPGDTYFSFYVKLNNTALGTGTGQAGV